MSGIKLENIRKQYGDTIVINHLNLTIEEGERVVFLGPSGCGKSTTLRIIAGLETIDGGQIYLNGQEVSQVPSGARDVAMVFQNYALYPNMTVKENICFGLKANKIPKQEIQERLMKALKMLKLEAYQDRLPKDLSGGQRQRVALARAVVKRSKYFLLDEPLSNLDVTLRQSARNELIEIHNTYQQTFVYVTHDQVEAMTIGQRIVLMNQGQIQMIGTPEEVYNYPANVFTASFIGSPRMNLQNVRYEQGILHLGSQTMELGPQWKDYLSRISTNLFILGVRPEHIEIQRTESENAIKAQVTFTENLGPNYAIHVATNTTNWIVISDIRDWQIGEEAYIIFDLENIHLFDQNSQENIGYPHRMVEA